MSVVASMANWGGKLLSMQGVNVALTGYFGLDAYKTAKEEGQGTIGAVGSATMAMALPFVMGIPGYLGFELLTSAPGLAMDAYKWQKSYRRRLGSEQMQRAFQNMSFQDNQQTYTMRQAAMAISDRSRYNTQAAMLGNEAQYMLK